MREKINRLASGIIDRDTAQIEILPKTMDLPIKSGEIIRMDLDVNSTNQIHVKGLVYSVSYRVKVLTPSFGGLKNKIQIEVDSRFLKSGAVIEGKLDLVTNAGEFEIPYLFRILTGQTNGALSEIKTAEDFTIIAKEDPATALRVFEYKDFINLPFMDDIRLRALYEAFSGRNNKSNALEEFLLALGTKEAVKVTAVEKEIALDVVPEDIKTKLTLQKNTWGYLGFAVKSDADFIELGDKHITDTDFTENTLDYPFTVKKSRLHRGKNEATISFVSVGQTVNVHVSAFCKSGSDEYLKRLKIEFKKHFYEYTKHRLAYECGVEDKTKCLDGMLRSLEELSTTSQKSEYIKLLKAEAFVLMGSKSRAADILDSIRNTVKERRVELAEEYILLEHLEIRVFGKEGKKLSLIRLIRRMIEEDKLYLLLITLIDLDDRIADDPSALFEFFRQQYESGCRSPYLYVLYCRFLSRFPEFLHDMGEFEIQALYCVAKYNGINAELAKIIARRAGNVGLDEGLYFSLLKRLYRSSPEAEFLRVVCQAFIKSDVVGEKVHEWYADGIAEDLQLAGLFENFIYSLPDNYNRRIPSNVLLYFENKPSLLDTIHRGYIYENILRFYEPEDEVYRVFIKAIERYALEQIHNSRIDHHLATIYQHVLRPEMVDARMAKAAPAILSSVRIENVNPHIKSLVVIYPQLRGENTYSFSDGDAYIPVPTDDTVILMQDSYGNRYSRFDVERKKSVDLPEVLDACYAMVPDSPLRKVSRLKSILDTRTQNPEDALFLEECMKEMNLFAVCKEKILSYLVRFYRDASLRLTGPDEWSMGKNEMLLSADKSLLNQQERTMVCDTLIVLGYTRDAYEMIRLYDCHDIRPDNLVRLCTKMLIDRMFLEEPLLLMLAFRAVDQGNRDGIILEYVAKHFNGSSKDMYTVLRASVEEHTQTEDLEERLLAQLIFINSKKYIDQTFAWYVSRKKSDEVLNRAFFTVKSCQYFMDNLYTSDRVFERLEDAILSQSDRKNIAYIYKLAITKYYSTLPTLSPRQADLASELINGLIREDIIFPYYRDFGKEIDIPEDILDKSVVVFNAEKAKHIRLRSRIKPFDKEYRADEMRRMVLDYLSKERILFEGETWEYKIYDLAAEEDVLLEDESISYSRTGGSKATSRFDSLNLMTKSEGHELKSLMEDYIVKEEMSKVLFGISDRDLGGKR